MPKLPLPKHIPACRSMFSLVPSLHLDPAEQYLKMEENTTDGNVVYFFVLLGIYHICQFPNTRYWKAF